MFDDFKGTIKRVMAAEMAIDPNEYDYIAYLKKNVLPVILEIKATIEPFCQIVSVDYSPNSASLHFSTELTSANRYIIEVTPDCKFISFELSSGEGFYYEKTFNIKDPTQDDREVVWTILTKFLELRLDHIKNVLNDDPEVQNITLNDQYQNYQSLSVQDNQFINT